MREKLSFLERAAALNATVCFQHDIDVALAKIKRSDKGGFEAIAL
jgi:hypothetical protein